ncbi:M24 family metallopeptidase [Novosphingobium aquae]|uniref:M24 family metallopeptidase n=1 Tax=Novosphingobium aquae TaxID=3133435 RepID=A0ABU8S752_9SPHN
MTGLLSTDEALYAALEREGPMNLARAAEVMERHGLDGLVLGQPVNVFHALGHWPAIARTRIGQPPGVFALLTRERLGEWGLVTSRFLYYYTWADGRQRGDVQPWLYGELGDAGDLEPGNPFPMCPDSGEVALSALERHRADALAMVDPGRGDFRDVGAALVNAMKGMGLWRGRVGFDDPVIAAVMARHEYPGAAVPADNIVREIRLIKSPLEQALMARAAEANAQAVIAAAQTARAGARHCELQALFRAEAAKRGNTSVFLNVDRVSSDLSRAELADGQTLFLDGVSHFLHYHGDFARTLFIGDPPKSARRAAEASGLAWRAIREKLKPGLRYSEIVEIGQKAVRCAGFETQIGFGPHSVGLAHTDEPGEDHGGFWRKPDLVLEAGMVLSVDCPVLDTGIGGSAHCEDLMLITQDGAQCIHSEHETVIVI